MSDYDSTQVTKALMQLVANGGNIKKTAGQLIDDEFMVPESTLRYWMTDSHREQFRRLEDEYGRQLESEAVQAARLRIARAAEIEEELLENIDAKRTQMDGKDLAQALRAVTDTKAKNVDRLLALTGRPVSGQTASTPDIVTLVEQMAAKGLVRLAAGVELQAAPQLPRGD